VGEIARAALPQELAAALQAQVIDRTARGGHTRQARPRSKVPATARG
jgi:hypothetical protein